MLRIAGEIEESIVDGPGLRTVIFFQGCNQHCRGCQNPETWEFKGGKFEKPETIVNQIKENPLITGVTLSGGDPLDQKDIVSLADLCYQCKMLDYNIWLYTGKLWEDVVTDKKYARLWEYIDVCVDGPFILEKKSLECKWRGSTNQRLIDVSRSVKEGTTVCYLT